jgi:formamidopyrimidine-DNA glycosylase
MPELPEVEGFKRYLDSTSLHARIVGVETDGSERVYGTDPQRFGRALEGNELESTHRHGNYLLARITDGPWLAMHFGLTGYLSYFEDMDEEPDHDRLLLGFENGYHLAYVSQRMLGQVDLVGGPVELVERRRLGPDALDQDLDVDVLVECMSERDAAIKSVLMDQSLLAGVGNIYADEILFQSRVAPAVHARDLGEKTLRRILDKLDEVLRTAAEADAERGRLPAGYLLACRERGADCPRCEDRVEETVVAGRPTFLCPSCQDTRG